MLTPQEIREKVVRRYPDLLRAVLTGDPFFPLEIRFGKPSSSAEYLTLRQEVGALSEGAKEAIGYGYSVEWETKQTRRYGSQTLPRRVFVATEADFLRLIGKEEEFQHFREAALALQARFPALREWLIRSPARLLPYLDRWQALLALCEYLAAHPRPTLYPRELPVPVHSKFVEDNQGILREWLDLLLPPDAIRPDESRFEPRFGLRYDEPLLRLRLLDPALQGRLRWPVADLSTPLSEAAALPLAGYPIIIVENRMTFLTLPALPNGLAIWGGGFRVALLAAVPWLADCPVWYWGDLDSHGFAILDHLRTLYPRAQSLMMDATTLDAFRDFIVPGSPATADFLPHLTPEEAALHAYLHRHTLRLEQEKISQPYIRRAGGSASAIPVMPSHHALKKPLGSQGLSF